MPIDAESGWLYLPRFLSPHQCQTVLETFQAAGRGDLPLRYLGLSDSSDEVKRCTTAPGLQGSVTATSRPGR